MLTIIGRTFLFASCIALTTAAQGAEPLNMSAAPSWEPIAKDAFRDCLYWPERTSPLPQEYVESCRSIAEKIDQSAKRDPYSCRLVYNEERECSLFGKCPALRDIERLKQECLHDGGRP